MPICGSDRVGICRANTVDEPVRPRRIGADPASRSNERVAGATGAMTTNPIADYEVENYAELRALTRTYRIVFVRGRLTQSDGGQGFFVWSPGDTSADDDGTTIRPTSCPRATGVGSMK